MSKMNLSLKDRLVLANQYRILEKLYPEDAEQFARNREIIESGYVLFYDDLSIPIVENELSQAACKEVLDILDMYRRLRHGYEKIEDKGKIKAADIEFPGFDGNNETSQLCFHEFLEKQRKFQESPALNSHMPTLGMYRRMLTAYQPFKDKQRLEKSDIEGVIAAQIHPENRHNASIS